MVSKLWKNYNSSHAYDGYFTKDNKLRKHATIISSILERYGKEKLQGKPDVSKGSYYANPQYDEPSTDAELIKKEFGQLVDAITDLGIEIYIAPARYFGHKDQGIYHTKYNAVFLNLRYMRDTKKLIGTLRHEGCHLAQDCMAGTLDNT